MDELLVGNVYITFVSKAIDKLTIERVIYNSDGVPLVLISSNGTVYNWNTIICVHKGKSQ